MHRLVSFLNLLNATDLFPAIISVGNELETDCEVCFKISFWIYQFTFALYDFEWLSDWFIYSFVWV